MVEFLVIRYVIYTIAFCIIQSFITHQLPINSDDEDALKILLIGGLVWAFMIIIIYLIIGEEIKEEDEPLKKWVIGFFIFSVVSNGVLFVVGASYLVRGVIG